MSLTRWRDEMEDNFEELVNDQGEKDCNDITQGNYLHLCKYKIKVTGTESRIGSRRIRE